MTLTTCRWSPAWSPHELSAAVASCFLPSFPPCLPDQRGTPEGASQTVRLQRHTVNMSQGPPEQPFPSTLRIAHPNPTLPVLLGGRHRRLCTGDDSLLDLWQYKRSERKLKNAIKRHEPRSASPVCSPRVNRLVWAEGCWRPCRQQHAGKGSEASLNLASGNLSSAKLVQELKRFFLFRPQLQLHATAHV